jgi:hypothetical protein
MWAQNVMYRASYAVLDCGFHAARPPGYSVPVWVERNMSLLIGLAIAPGEQKAICEWFCQELKHIEIDE